MFNIRKEVLIHGVLAMFVLVMGFTFSAYAGDDESVPPGFACLTKADADAGELAETLFCLRECDDDDDDDDDNGIADCNRKECELDGIDDGDDGVVCAALEGICPVAGGCIDLGEATCEGAPGKILCCPTPT